tara:strand:- start:912 stop:1946 length:1035 start_codon:yes stop_codon:yes gene_type:complete
MENIYQQAIADAKALRASAMANAKSALQEAFEPQIKEMVRLKLSEELEEDLEEDQLEETEEFEEGMEPVDETIDDSSLEEILAELEELTNEDDSYEENVELEEAEDKDGDDVDAETETDDNTDDEEGETEETQEITVSLGELKGIIEQLKNLDPALSGGEVVDDEEDMEDMEAGEEVKDDEESFSLDEILAELEEEDALEEKKAGAYKHSVKATGKKVDHAYSEKVDEAEKELKDAKHTIAELTQSLNEVNLLNAKLLYMNKIFKAKTLTESQKIQVVKAFDKATSVKEVKNTFEILKESVTAKKKSQIQESFGYASKPAGVSPRTNVIDADPFVNRWQKLAGL